MLYNQMVERLGWAALVVHFFLMNPARALQDVMSEFQVDYTNFKLVKVSELTNEAAFQLRDAGYDKWAHDDVSGASVYLVSPEQLKNLQVFATDQKEPVSVEIINENIQETIENEQMNLFEKSSTAQIDWFQTYHKFEEIRDWYQQMSAKSQEIMRFVPEIGKTNEGRPIFAIHIGSQALLNYRRRQNRPKKPHKIWIQCLIHAREWITGSTCQYITDQLVKGYYADNNDTTIRDFLDQNEVIMIPVVNPDGYVHTWTRDRLWRKNRRWFRFGTGVDLNRNFNNHWGEQGSSHAPFTDTYCGPDKASESETQAIQNYYGKFKGDVAVALDIHCFSQLILRPNGYSSEDCPDEKKLMEASELMARAIKQASGKIYEPKKSSQLYPTTGTATDYFYWLEDQQFRPYSVTTELRPGASRSYNGFIVDPSQIIPCGEEMMAGLIAFASYAIENPLPANSKHDEIA